MEMYLVEFQGLNHLQSEGYKVLTEILARGLKNSDLCTQINYIV